MSKSKNVATFGLLAAIIIVLQLLSYVVKIGQFNLSLVLIPIVLGAYLFGTKTGTLLGTIFGITVVFCCVTGLEQGGYILFTASPILTAVVCILKGAAAGFLAGITAKITEKLNGNLSIMLCAVTAPIVNTGLFILSLLLLFKDILNSWAGGTNLVTYILVGLVGVNFIIELLINIIFAPAILNIKKAVKKYI